MLLVSAGISHSGSQKVKMETKMRYVLLQLLSIFYCKKLRRYALNVADCSALVTFPTFSTVASHGMAHS